LPTYETGEYLPIMSWRAYEDPRIGLKYITEDKYHFLIAMSSIDSLNFDALLQCSGSNSTSKIKQYFYNRGWGASIPLFMSIYHPNGVVSDKSRVIVGYKPQTSTIVERPIYLLPLSLDMPIFKWENPKEKLDINNGNYQLVNSAFELTFPNAQLISRVNSGNSDGVEQLLYVPMGINKFLNLNTDDTIEIEASDDNNTSTVEWEFSVKKVPNRLSINEKLYDGSKELKIEVADTPLTTQEILSILI
jgi:hypothetical protein